MSILYVYYIYIVLFGLIYRQLLFGANTCFVGLLHINIRTFAVNTYNLLTISTIYSIYIIFIQLYRSIFVPELRK